MLFKRRIIRFTIKLLDLICTHKRMAWGCRRCGRIPNAEKLAIIWAKILKIWAKYTATFTCNEVVSIFQTEAK